MTAEDLFRCDLERNELDDLEIVADSGGSVDARTLRRLLDALASANAAMEGEDERQGDAIEEAVKEAVLEAMTNYDKNRPLWDQDRPHFGGEMPHRFESGVCVYCWRPESYRKDRDDKPARKRKSKLTLLKGGGR